MFFNQSVYVVYHFKVSLESWLVGLRFLCIYHNYTDNKLCLTESDAIAQANNVIVNVVIAKRYFTSNVYINHKPMLSKAFVCCNKDF